MNQSKKLTYATDSKGEGKQVKEIAQEMNMTETDVNNALRRAHYKLDKYLPDEFKKMRKNY